MPSVNVSPTVSKPSHSFALSWKGNQMGFQLEGGEPSLVEAPSSPPPSPFQWKQSTWEGGRANARSITDQTAYFDAQSLYTLTPETAHPAPQWGLASGITTDDIYCPQTRNVSWKALLGTERYVASSFVASSSYTMNRLHIWLKAVNKPGTLTVELWSSSGGSPSAMLKTSTITTSNITEFMSQWYMFFISSGQALTSGTTYWVVAFGASGDDSTNHWEVGIDSAPATFSKYSTAGSVWTTATYKMYFRSAATYTGSREFGFEYYGAQFKVSKFFSGAASKVYINGDLGKASAGTSTTITKTASGGLTWATDQLVGAWIRFVGGTGAGAEPRQISTHTSGTTPVFTVSAGFDITPDATTIFIIYATQYWSEITSPVSGLGVVVSAPATAGNTVYFPQGATAIRRMYFTESTGAYTFAADGANTADFLRTLNTDIWKTYTSSQTYAASSAPIAASLGTNLAFVGSYPIGGLDYKVTSLCDHKNAMYALKADGLYRITNGRATRINYGGESVPHVYNGRISISFQDSLYFSFLHSFERMTNDTVDDIGWWRHEGMPQGREATAIGVASYLSWLFVALDAGGSGESSVLCWNGMGWHEIFRMPFGNSPNSPRISGISVQPNVGTRPRLWIYTYNDAYYIDFPQDAINPLRDNGMVYMHESAIVTSRIDLNKIGFQKIFKNLILQTKNLSDTAYIDLDYQLDNGIGEYTYTSTGRTLANPFPWINAGRFQVSPVSSIDINRGNANMARLRLRFYTEVCYIPPIAYEVQLNGNVIDPTRTQWQATVKVSNTIKNDFTGDQIVAFLKDASSNMRLLLSHSTRATFDNQWVYVGQPTVIVESRNFLTRKWTGRIVFTVRQA